MIVAVFFHLNRAAPLEARSSGMDRGMEPVGVEHHTSSSFEREFYR